MPFFIFSFNFLFIAWIRFKTSHQKMQPAYNGTEKTFILETEWDQHEKKAALLSAYLVLYCSHRLWHRTHHRSALLIPAGCHIRIAAFDRHGDPTPHPGTLRRYL